MLKISINSSQIHSHISVDLGFFMKKLKEAEFLLNSAANLRLLILDANPNFQFITVQIRIRLFTLFRIRITYYVTSDLDPLFSVADPKPVFRIRINLNAYPDPDFLSKCGSGSPSGFRILIHGLFIPKIKS